MAPLDGFSLFRFIKSSPNLLRSLQPISNAYANAAGHRKVGLKYDDLIIEEDGKVQKVSRHRACTAAAQAASCRAAAASSAAPPQRLAGATEAQREQRRSAAELAAPAWAILEPAVCASTLLCPRVASQGGGSGTGTRDTRTARRSAWGLRRCLRCRGSRMPCGE